jgi:hypothetical protein
MQMHNMKQLISGKAKLPFACCNGFFVLIFFSICTFYNIMFAQQTFPASISSTVDLASAVGTCAAPGTLNTSYFEIPVSGVGTLSSTNALYGLTLNFSGAAGSYRVRNLNIMLVSPNGTCVTVYSGGNVSGNNGGLEFYGPISPGTLNATRGSTTTFSMRLVTFVSCLRYPKDYVGTSGYTTTTPGGNFSIDGNALVLASPNNLTTGFNGLDPNGTWKLIFGGGASDSPALVSASITFGDPTSTNQTSNGNNCTNAINWTGAPICAQTNGMTSSTNMPGWAGPAGNTFGTFSGGATCAWNGANNNDVWISFVAQTSNVCINISSVIDQLQSVVVTDPNTDNDNNPCSFAGNNPATNGQYWQLVNCPRDAIYNTTFGRPFAHNHCFSANIGQTYYLVVDGNSGAESPFYISGISGTAYNLPIELVNFNASLENRITEISWQTASEKNNDYFLIERSQNGMDWELVDEVDGAGNSNELLSYKTYDFHPYRGVGYYRLKQVDYDGEYSYSEIRSVYNTDDLMILPNPSTGIFGIGGMPKHQENMVVVLDITGKVLEQHSTEEESYQLDLTHCSAGVYLVIINGTESIRVIKE